MSAAVIVSCDTPPVFKTSEHYLDLVALFIKVFAKVSRRPSAFTWRKAVSNAFGDKSAAKLIAIVALVADKRFSVLRQRRINQLCTDVIACLSRC